jgi:hypothetical protein
MKKKATRHYAHVAHAIHHHHVKHMPKVFYHNKFLISSIFWNSVFLLFLCSFLWYFLIHNLAPQTIDSVAVENEKMLFSLEGNPEDWGVDPAVVNTHGAASNEFDFLFQPNTDTSSTVDTSTPTIKDSQTPVVDSSSDVGAPVQSTSWSISTWTVSTWILPSETPVSCTTAWGEKVQNQDFVLAYQQRSDVNSLCNVQKRYCSNGKLTGTYTQKSCKEDLKYSYTKITPTAENDPNYVDPFIQPSDPSLNWAKFDTNWKIISTSKPVDTWSDSGKSPTVSTGPYVTQTATTTSNSCTTPWWEKVPFGKFVKAYKSSVWLIDMPCDVEIRLCTKAWLKGSFKQSSCTYKNMTYSDYLLDRPENADQPNIVDMNNIVNSDSSNSIFKWLTKYF